MWREDGFLRSQGPHEAVIDRLPRLRYLETLEAVAADVPDLDLVVCPFRSDLLLRGNVIDDFASRFLGMAVETSGIQVNPSLPLRLGQRPAMRTRRRLPQRRVGAVPARQAAEGRRRARPAANRRDPPLAPHPSALLPRVFEDEFQELIRRLSWPAKTFVPNVKLDEPWDIAELDTLWAPTESPSELAELHRQLESALRAP